MESIRKTLPAQDRKRMEKIEQISICCTCNGSGLRYKKEWIRSIYRPEIERSIIQVTNCERCKGEGLI
jgi:uncharacterized protein with PIN domain